MADFAGLVLAGGESSRMGSDKALLKNDGLNLLDMAVQRLNAAGANPVLVSGERPDYDCVTDSQPGRGPLGGLASVLAARPGLGDRLLMVTAVDTPGLSADSLLQLMRSMNPSDSGIHFVGHPLPLVLRASPALRQVLDQLLSQASGPPVHALASEMGFRAIQPRDADLSNINTPQDWVAFIKGRQTDGLESETQETDA